MRLVSIPAIVAAMTLACSDSVAPVKAATIDVSSIADQKAFAGTTVDSDPEVLVRDGSSSPLAGIRVKFTVVAGGGAVTHSTDISDAQGRATAGQWILGVSAGANTLVANVEGAGPVQFHAEGVAVPAGTFQLVTVNGEPLPFPDWLDGIPLVGGTFRLTASKAFELVLVETFFDSPFELQTEGSFVPRLPSSFSFYVGTRHWHDGTIRGDTLTVNWADGDDPLTLVFIKETSQ